MTNFIICFVEQQTFQSTNWKKKLVVAGRRGRGCAVLLPLLPLIIGAFPLAWKWLAVERLRRFGWLRHFTTTDIAPMSQFSSNSPATKFCCNILCEDPVLDSLKYGIQILSGYSHWFCFPPPLILFLLSSPFSEPLSINSIHCRVLRDLNFTSRLIF